MMRTGHNSIQSREDKEESAGEWDGETKPFEAQADPSWVNGKPHSKFFFDYDYEELREKQLKLMGLKAGGAAIKRLNKHRPQSKIAEMIREHFDSKRENGVVKLKAEDEDQEALAEKVRKNKFSLLILSNRVKN